MTQTQTAPPTVSPDPLNPPLQCDLVMKGGITSGVVYPAAVSKLKDFYRFRSIGGASAGAIAAAFTAAAEFARESRSSAAGFGGLEAVRGELKDSQKQTLKRLFRADGPTSPLLKTLVELT